MGVVMKLMCVWSRICAVAAIVLLSALATPTAQAQVPLKMLSQSKASDAQSSTGIDALLQQAEKDGSTIIVMRPAGQQAETPDMPMAMALSSENLLKARESLKRMVANAWIYFDVRGGRARTRTSK